MKKQLLKTMIAALIMMTGGVFSAFALETYDFQELCMKLGKGGPWAVNDGGDAGFTINEATMHYLGDYTDQGFTWNQRFAYEFVDGRGKFTMRNKNNKKDKNCGMFSWDFAHYFSILDLKDGDKVTITTLAGTTKFVSTNVVEEVSEGDAVASGTAYTIATTEGTTRLDIQMASATLISKIVIEPYGVETVPTISLSKSTLALIPGASQKLKATVDPSGMATQWSSSDESVATIAGDGTVTAVAAGTAIIKNSWESEVSDAKSEAECVVTVADVDLDAYDMVNIDFTTMGDVTLELGDKAGAIWNDANSKNNDVYWCTNDNLGFLALQAVTDNPEGKGWMIIDNEGLYLASGAGRCAAICDIQKGQIVEFIYTGDGFFTKSDGSDDGILKTALNEGTGRAIYRADGNGMIGFELVKGNAVQQINVYDLTFPEVDCTSMVGEDWQSEQGNVGSVTLDGIAQKEQYNGGTTANCDGDVLYQVVEGLDNGTYTVELYANASYTSGRGFTSDIIDGELGRVIVYAGDVEKTIPVYDQGWVSTNNIVTLEDVIVTDGTLRMGLKKIAPGTNWHTIAIRSLTQTSNIDRDDKAAQDVYWNGIALTVAGYEAYANVSGSERAAITDAKTKNAAKAAIPPFYAAKAGYDALVDIIEKGKDAGFDTSEAEAWMASAEATAEQAAAMAEEMKHPINLAINTANATEGADMTYTIVNPSFETGDTRGWTYEPSTDHGAKRNDNATYTTEGCDGEYLFNIWSSGNAISQTIEDLPNGTYKLQALIATDKGHQVQLNANDKSIKIDASDDDSNAKGIGVEGELEFNVLDNKATIGAEGVDKYWYKVDNFRLTYVKGINLEELFAAYNEALDEAKKVEGDMNKDIKTTLDDAIAADETLDKTNADILGEATAALIEATANAKASVAAYENAANTLPKMKELTETTNVYTAEAYEEYYSQWVVKYEAKELTTAEANALQDPFLTTEWHSSITCDNFLLSAWDAEADKFEGYYINSWSVEGNNDGTNFTVPFFEYWTSDGNSLGEKTLTATMTEIPEGKYTVTAWVRVRAKNGATDDKVSGITMQLNDGEAVDVCTGEIVPSGGSFFKIAYFAALGDVASDGILNIKFNVAANSNISWLSFKNVNYVAGDATGIQSVATTAANTNAIYNLAGQRVMNAQKGLYIMNGKKVVKK